jgi:AcrR family transcriptional regulator
LYRHYAGKEDLLAAIAWSAVAHVDERLSSVDASLDGPERLRESIHATGSVSIEDNDAITVALRELRHLSAEHYRAIVEQTVSNTDRMVAAIRGVRADLDRLQAGFVLQSLAGLFLSPTDFPQPLASPNVLDIWATMGFAAVMDAPALPVRVGRRGRGEVQRPQASRREAIVRVAVALFRENGFGAVGMDDIGEAAGITGPSVYRHFTSKEEILHAVMTRTAEQIAASAAAAQAASSAAEMLARLVDGYIRIALDHPDAIAVYYAEVESLAEEHRRAIRQYQLRYLGEWRALLAELAPKLSTGDVRVAARGALGLVHGYATGGVRPGAEVSGPYLRAMVRGALSAVCTPPIWPRP